MSPRRDCFDWPQRPQRQGALSAQPAPVAPARAAAVTTGGERVMPTLLMLAALILLPVSCCYVAWLLIEAMTRAPIVFVIFGAALLFGGGVAWALCKAASEPMRIKNDDIVLYSPLYEMRFPR